MHVRVRVLGKPEAIVVVDSKLTKIEQLREQISNKCDIEPRLQRLFYGGKLLENGYTFHDYGIKLNDVIQVMIKVEPDSNSKTSKIQKENPEINIENIDESVAEKIVYTEAKSKLYGIGDLVDMKYQELGAWLEGKIIKIVNDPGYVKVGKADIKDVSQLGETLDIESKPLSELTNSNSDISKKKGIAGYFSKKPKNEVKQSTKTAMDETTEEGILYIVKMEAEGEQTDETEYACKLHEIRPRARKIIGISDLKVGMKVMINHNTDVFTEKGYWYDFKITEIVKRRKNVELVGTLYIGAESIPQNNTKAKILDYIYEIEEVVPLYKRTEEYQKLMTTPTAKRSAPLNCLTCRDDEDSPCRDCGCYKCSGKEFPEKIILCDECNHGYHMACLMPPLTDLPSEDWYCPDCKREEKVVAPGAAKQAKKINASKSKRDWGRGMACVGKTKSCAMPSNHFGPIPGIEVGMRWRFRIQISESGVHRPPVSGIHGRDVEGAYSIVLSGGYEDDYDDGFEFTYTGSGGRDLSGNKRTAEQSCDQTLSRENKALARNCAVSKISEDGGDAGDDWRKGKPVRVVRSYKMLKHFPQYAPQEGIRYDGIYKVVKYYPETGKSGFRVWKYLLRRDDPSPAPWDPSAKEYPIVYPDGYLEAEAEKNAMKAQGKGRKSGKKRKLPESQSSESADEVAVEDSPPSKKTKNMKTPETAKKRGRKSKNDSVIASPKEKIANMFLSKPANKTNGVSKTNADSFESILSKAEADAIHADKLNSKPWNECLEVSKTGNKKDFVEQVTQLFLCIICQDVPATPVTTSCLHNFCMGCIKLAFKSTGGKACPCCRRDLSNDDLQLNDALREALRAIMPGYDIGKK